MDYQSLRRPGKPGQSAPGPPILDLLLLGTCPETATDVLLDLLLTVAPYVRSMSVDQEMEDRGPLTWAPVRLLPEQQSFFLLTAQWAALTWAHTEYVHGTG